MYELFAVAQTSPVAPWLNREAKQIVVVENVELTDIEQEERLHNIKTTGFAGNKYATRGYPDEAKCRAIFDWLTQI